jgi:hypothetical protein
MTHGEFVEAMAYLTAGLARGLQKESAAVYFDALHDLPAPALWVAVKRALLEHRYATFPSIAMLRDFATLAMRGEAQELPWALAWKLAITAIQRCDVEVDGSVERAFRSVPPIVRQAVEAFGFKALYNLPGAQIEAARAQFRDIYEQLAKHERRTALLPVAIQMELSAIRNQRVTPLPAPVVKALAHIGAAAGDDV